MRRWAFAVGVLLMLPLFATPAQALEVAITGQGEEPSDLEAGSHPNVIVTTFDFPPTAFEGGVRDLRLELPAGLIENPSAVSECSSADFHTPRVSQFEASISGESCQPLSQIGVVEVRS